jgi:hypothetical protein
MRLVISIESQTERHGIMRQSPMDETELQKLIDAWIAHTDAPKNSAEREANWWAIKEVMNWSSKSRGSARLLWAFILAAYPRQMSDRAWSYLAAGPLEDLLTIAGEDYIENVEQLAKTDEKFNDLLGGVWRNRMSKDVWRRVQRVRREEW